MLTTLVLSMMLASVDGTATFEGTYLDASGATHTYSVDAAVDGTIRDSEGRTGTYSIVLDSTGNRNLILDFGRTDIYTLYEGPSNCWEEAQPPVNPNLIELAICLSPYDHRIAHFDTQACGDLDTAPIFHTAAVFPQESGHWMAGRLTSDSPNGFWVHDVTYVLNTAYNQAPYVCAPVDHKVQLFMASANSFPPAIPVVVHEFDVPGATLLNEYSEVTLDLPAPLFLPPGQSLFVSVEMLDDGVEEVCAAMCGSGSMLPDHTYWSDAAVTPYAWYDLEAFPGFHDMMVQAHGIAAN